MSARRVTIARLQQGRRPKRWLTPAGGWTSRPETLRMEFPDFDAAWAYLKRRGWPPATHPIEEAPCCIEEAL